MGLEALTLTYVQSLINNPSSGLLDEFGTGTASGSSATLYALPAALDSVAGDGWFLAQWGQSTPIKPSNYAVNSAATYDPLYGNALYSWSSAGSPSSFSIYRNTPAFGSGDVYQISLGNTAQPAISGQSEEADSFMSTPPISPSLGNLSHPITLSLNAKLLASYVSFVNSQAAQEFADDPYIFSTIDFGFTVNFDGADGLPAYSGFVQIVPWLSNNEAASSYETIPVSSDLSDPSQFISSLLLGVDRGLSLLPSDKAAAPVNLSYDVNEYVYATLQNAFANFSGGQLAALLNLANWSIGGMYLGLATNGQNFENLSNDKYMNAADLLATLQLSNIQLTSATSQTYNPNSPFATAPSADTNPKISFYDVTAGAGGVADGGAYTGALTGISYEYIYNGSDSLRLTAPVGANWYFGGGTAMTALTAVSGNNLFQASPGSSFMTGGSGNDDFDVPDANTSDQTVWDTIVNFQAGEQVNLAGLAGTGWTYAWAGIAGASGATGLTLLAQSKKYPGLAERITLAGVTSVNNSGGQISLVRNTLSGLLEIVFTKPAVPASVANVSAATLAGAVASASKMTFIAPADAGTGSTPALTAATVVLDTQSGLVTGASVVNTATAVSMATALLQTTPDLSATGWIASVRQNQS
jgi:hypothetical protein